MDDVAGSGEKVVFVTVLAVAGVVDPSTIDFVLLRSESID